MSMYAIIPEEQWVDELSERFQHAPTIKDYRVIVFADAETEQLKTDYTERGIVEMSSSGEIIEHIEINLKPWVILQIDPLRAIMQHFNPPKSAENF